MNDDRRRTPQWDVPVTDDRKRAERPSGGAGEEGYDPVGTQDEESDR